MTGLARTAALDASAITLSALCLIHCLALPLLAAVLPIAGLFAEAEWVHKAFVATAVPITGLVVLRGWPHQGGKAFAALAVTGLGLLAGAAFIEALHDLETALTVAGACLLAAAHAWHWSTHTRNQAA